jgi:hypothetical protein
MNKRRRLVGRVHVYRENMKNHLINHQEGETRIHKSFAFTGTQPLKLEALNCIQHYDVLLYRDKPLTVLYDIGSPCRGKVHRLLHMNRYQSPLAPPTSTMTQSLITESRHIVG